MRIPILITITCIVLLVGALFLKVHTDRTSPLFQPLLNQGTRQEESLNNMKSLYQPRPVNTTPNPARTTPPATVIPTPFPSPTPKGLELTPITTPPGDIIFPTPTPTASPSPTPAPDCVTTPYEICFFDLDNTNDPVDNIKNAPLDSTTKKTIMAAFSYLQVKKSILNNYALVIMQDKDYGGMNVKVVMNQLKRPVGTLEYQKHLAVDPSYQIIQLNTDLAGGDLTAETTHCVGRIVWPLLSQSEQAQYSKLRPTNNMKESLLDDFAEVFKYVFGDKSQGGNLWDVRTTPGNPDQTAIDFMHSTISPKFR